jgi:RNA polymerase sigma-70 factor (ECF subfamily)
MDDTRRDEVLAKVRERIVAYAASHIGRDAAEDLAQETLLLLEEKYGQVEGIEDLLPLSLQIVRYKMMALRRKALRRGEYNQVSVTDIQVPDLGANPADFAERRETMERLTRAVAQLGPRCRELLRLKLEGRSFAEIQKKMGAATLNTVYTWDHRCRKHLLDLMGGDWEVRR